MKYGESMIDLGSTIRGLSRLRKPYPNPKPRWAIRWIASSDYGTFWFYAWTPRWHRGRGPYLSIGIRWFAIYRGY